MARDVTAPAKELWPKDHFRRPLLETSLHERLGTQMRAHDWCDWAGYLAARVIEDVELEYTAIRNACAIYDISPLIKYRVSGADAEAYLDRLTLRSVATLQPGRVHRTAWCDDAGKVLDDGTLFRLSESEFRLYSRERHLPWLLDSLPGFEVTVEEVTRRIAGLALQGPTAAAVMKRAGFNTVDTLEPGAMRSFPLAATGVDVLVSRTGITGDLGYEMFLPADQGPTLWDVLWRAGRLHGVRAAGTAAVDMARIEAGHVQAGRDYVPAGLATRVDRRRSPYEIGLGWMVDFDKGHFNGRRALDAERKADSGRYVLVGLDIEGNGPADGAVVYHRRTREVGTVTSAIWSPMTKRNIALATVEKRYGTRSTSDLWVDVHIERERQVERSLVRARIVGLPFLRQDHRSATPPGGF